MKHPPPDWLLALFLIAGVFLWQRTTFPLWHIDLFHIQLAALSWHNDKPDKMYVQLDDFETWRTEYYQPEADRLGAWGEANAYFYPPFLAGLLSPFADVHAFTWRNVVFAINVLLLFVFASQIVRLTEAAFNWRGYLWALALVLITYPFARACTLGQIVPLQAALFWEGLLRLRKSRTLSPLLIGSVVALKLFPAGWLCLPALRKQWRVVLYVLVVVLAIYAASVAAMGGEIHLRWWQAIQEFGSTTFTYFTNQSPVGWFSRAVQGHSLMQLHAGPTLGVAIVRLATLTLFVGSLLLLWLRRKQNVPFAIEQGLVITALLLALPVTWEHYFLFALPPLGVAVFQEWKRGNLDSQSLLLFFAAFFFTMKLTHFYGDDPLGKIISGSQCFGLILFWFWLVLQVRSAPHSRAEFSDPAGI
ncbi:MAG: DUF2029 domain-containing protein [Calditrichaeota bacterium]|nr:DUF2029 domain-containing protein [Calditrichota bacterium]MCB9391604.1 DUF2029 domain-containing protein [Calditrichota bacterium]